MLQLLAEGMTNKEVAAALTLGVSTVETHRLNLMQKLNLHNTAELVLVCRPKEDSSCVVTRQGDATHSTAISAHGRDPCRFLATKFVGDVDDRLGPADRIDSALGWIIVGHLHATIDLPQERVVGHPAPDPHREHILIGMLIEAAQQVHAEAGVHGCADVVVPLTT